MSCHVDTISQDVDLPNRVVTLQPASGGLSLVIVDCYLRMISSSSVRIWNTPPRETRGMRVQRECHDNSYSRPPSSVPNTARDGNSAPYTG